MSAKQHPQIRKYCEERGWRDPVHAYKKQKSGAKARGIGFDMTFEQWWDFWRESYHLRGQADEQLCMGRIGDVGPYALGNVQIITNKQNELDYVRGQKCKEDTAARVKQRMDETLEYISLANARHGPHLPFEEMMRRRAVRQSETRTLKESASTT